MTLFFPDRADTLVGGVMRYLGGKVKIRKWVREVVLSVKGDKTHYVEPFVGAGATFAHIAPEFQRSTARDAHPDLILMWQALQAGWDPPTHVTREEYEQLRHAAPSALRGLAGFGSSWGGVWFSGYTDVVYDTFYSRNTLPYMAAAVRSLPKVVAAMRSATVEHGDFSDWIAAPDQLIYCDPPYRGTSGYKGTTFDSDDFWVKAREWADAGATVIVSESQAPESMIMLAERTLKARLQVIRGGVQAVRNERIWLVPPRD